MNLEDFRRQMESFRRDVDREATSLKDPYVALDQLHGLYRALSAEERGLADQVLSEWVMAEDEKLRFEALALISDFKIRSAEPALRNLARHLAGSKAPSAPYELKKIHRILDALAQP